MLLAKSRTSSLFTIY